MLIALFGQGRERLGRDVGLAYAANTAGAIVGSLAGGFGAAAVALRARRVAPGRGRARRARRGRGGPRRDAERALDAPQGPALRRCEPLRPVIVIALAAVTLLLLATAGPDRDLAP